MKLLLVGDSHGDKSFIRQAFNYAMDVKADIVFQLGDFGYGWDLKQFKGKGNVVECAFTHFVNEEAERVNVPCFWIDGNHECLDIETRAVTRRGFVSLENLLNTDEVLSVNDEGGELWLPINNIIKRHYNGSMINIQSRSLDMLITPGHRIVGNTKHWQRNPLQSTKWIEYSADKALEHQFDIVVAANNNRSELDIADDEIRLAAWCLTDSYQVPKYGYWRFYQRESKANLITDILDSLNLTYSVSRRHRSEISSICGTQTQANETECTIYVNADSSRKIRWNKNIIADEMFHLSARQIQIFLDSLIDTDGSTPTGAKNSRVLYCSRQELREQLQTLFISSGYRVSTTEYRKNHWRLNICNKNTVDIDLRSNRNRTKYQKVPYNNIVWCLQVANGRFFVERYGKVYLTGNCFDWLDEWMVCYPERQMENGTWNVGNMTVYVPRGTRLEFDGVSFLCCGGATSVDRKMRTPFVSWWPQEAITDADIETCAAADPVDVLLTHDFPWQVNAVDRHLDPFWGEWAANAVIESRKKISTILANSGARYQFHGHLHYSYQEEIYSNGRPVIVKGLDCNQNPLDQNTYLLDTDKVLDNSLFKED